MVVIFFFRVEILDVAKFGKIKNSKITMAKKNDALSITSEDEKLIEALKKNFPTVRIEMKYSP